MTGHFKFLVWYRLRLVILAQTSPLSDMMWSGKCCPRESKMPTIIEVANLVCMHATKLKAYPSNHAYDCVFNPLYENVF